MKQLRKNLTVPSICLVILSLIISSTGSVTLAQGQVKEVRMIQEMEAEQTGVLNPVGVVFSERGNEFLVVETIAIATTPGWTELRNVSMFGQGTGFTRVNFVVEDPINVAMDNQMGRLLVYQAAAKQLIEVREDAGGMLNGGAFMVVEADSWGVQDAQGMTFDPLHGELFILDASGPAMVRIKTQGDASSPEYAVARVRLNWMSAGKARGIAYDPTTGTLQIGSPSEQKLYEYSVGGDLVDSRDVSGVGLKDPQGMVFAPSGDQTDDPQELSLYIADRGSIRLSQADSLEVNREQEAPTPGLIKEISLNQIQNEINATFVSELVKTTDMSTFSPPSPDPSGIAYLISSNTLLISDSEVEETVGGITHFMGVNLWETTLAGTVVNTANISSVQPTKAALTDEPTGVAWNPGSGHYFFSDDVEKKVSELNQGIDGRYATADDRSTSFSTMGPLDTDPEGIAYDNWHDRLFVADGINAEVFQYTLAGEYVGQFDVAGYGLIDPGCVEFNRISGTLFILGHNNLIIETTTGGALLQTIDISNSASIDASGLTYAPASDGSGAMHFYIVDRGIDNNVDPNIIDGKLYEMTAPAPSTPDNTPPVVNAGADQTISFGNNASLSGSVTDDGKPKPPAHVTNVWSQVSGEGTATIAQPASLNTAVSFSSTGTYVLRLTSNDSALSSYDEVTLYVVSTKNSLLFEARVTAKSDDALENGSHGEYTTPGMVYLDDLDLELGWNGSNQYVGLRFRGIDIPKFAHIINAYIEFRVDDVSLGTIPLVIWGEAQDNPGTFIAAATPNMNISSRVKTSAQVNWSPPEWNLIGLAGINQRTTNISSILQEILNRPGWVKGNSLVIIIQDGLIKANRSASAYDGLPMGAARLHIEYSLTANNIFMPVVKR